MLLSYDEFFQAFFEKHGVSEEDGRAQLELFESLMDLFVIAGIEGKFSGKDFNPDSDPTSIPLEWDEFLTVIFNGAAHDSAAGKKEI